MAGLDVIDGVVHGALHSASPVTMMGHHVCGCFVRLFTLSSMQELLDKCHPLGMFDSISTLAVASNMRELYRLVLVDTPLAPYFAESLTSGQHRVACPISLPGRSH